jgi:hypothetical protein
MMNVCQNCGQYRADKIIEPNGPFAVCPVCGFRQLFRQLPLLLVSGASGTGKSAVHALLSGKLSQAVLLDSDILWRPEYDRPEDGYRDYFETWLRLSKNISQSGRPVVLFGAGIGVPGNLEPCVERRYFGPLYYLGLVCSDEVLEQRLRRRPAWRNSGHPEFIAAQLSFNRWFKENSATATPPVDLLDTTDISLETTAAQVAGWIKLSIGHYGNN